MCFRRKLSQKIGIAGGGVEIVGTGGGAKDIQPAKVVPLADDRYPGAVLGDKGVHGQLSGRKVRQGLSHSRWAKVWSQSQII